MYPYFDINTCEWWALPKRAWCCRFSFYNVPFCTGCHSCTILCTKTDPWEVLCNIKACLLGNYWVSSKRPGFISAVFYKVHENAHVWVHCHVSAIFLRWVMNNAKLQTLTCQQSYVSYYSRWMIWSWTLRWRRYKTKPTDKEAPGPSAYDDSSVRPSAPAVSMTFRKPERGGSRCPVHWWQ